jgi:hypothetical protein
MPEISLTDTAYDAVENLEKRKTKIALMIFACFCVAALGLGLSAFSFMMYSHQKGAITDSMTMPIGILAFFCVGMAAIGMQRYILLRNIDEKLQDWELLEKTIYNDVFISQPDFLAENDPQNFGSWVNGAEKS